MSLTRGAIVLCGGQSSRMGRDKASLPFGAQETLLERVVRLVAEVVPTDRIVVVAAEVQSLPSLRDDVQIVRDRFPQLGPLAGLAAGLNAILNRADAAFVCGCDTPLLVPAVVTRLFELLGDRQVVAVHDGERFQPLTAVYRTDVLPVAELLLAAGERSLVALLDRCDTCRVPLDRLREIDPELASLATCNTPEEYERLLARAFPPTN